MYDLIFNDQQLAILSTNIERNENSFKAHAHQKHNKTLHKKLGFYGGNVSKFKDYAFKKKSAISFYQTLYIAGVYQSINNVCNQSTSMS